MSDQRTGSRLMRSKEDLRQGHTQGGTWDLAFVSLSERVPDPEHLILLSEE